VKPYLVAPEAEDDLRKIWRYLLEEAGLTIADRIQGELVDAFESLADLPGKGHKRADLTNRDVLFFSVYQYLIVYRNAEVWRSSPSCMASATCGACLKPAHDCDCPQGIAGNLIQPERFSLSASA
jgi:plasmid stabilization system protein ParE